MTIMDKKLQDTVARGVAEIFARVGIEIESANVNLSVGSSHRFNNGKPVYVSRGLPTVIVHANLHRPSHSTFAASMLAHVPLDGHGFAKTPEAASKKALQNLDEKITSFMNRLSESQRSILLNGVAPR